MVATTTTYADFLKSKRIRVTNTGINPPPLGDYLAPFQADLVSWALRKGRAALFTDTGTGKTRMQLEWANRLGVPTIILAPLSVARQTVDEASALGIPASYARTQGEVTTTITVTNYEMLHAFDPSAFSAVVLDESSILKAEDGKTRQRLIDTFARTPYRLACTATPAPNDVAEFANHAEFLGICTREEMLSMFFVHDDDGWRLKGHAVQPFYRWMASWAMMMKLPSDIGHSDEGYILPPLSVQPVIVDGDEQSVAAHEGKLMLTGMKGVTGRAAARKSSIDARVEAASAIINGSDDQWVVWCGLNDEGRALARAVPDAVLVEGSDALEDKVDKTSLFLEGTARVLISKVRISGFGLNLQRCHRMLFLGLNDSWEMYYQAIRRCWRYKQEHPVDVRVVISDVEMTVWDNVMRKDQQAEQTQREMVWAMASYERAELHDTDDEGAYTTDERQGQAWAMHLGDNTELLPAMQPESVDLAVFSPPFISLFVYSNSERDMGNCRTEDEFYQQLRYFAEALLPVLKPGRNTCVHVAQVPTTLVSDGLIGLRDFRGETVRVFVDAGFTFHGEVTIDKNPQAQAIRTHSKGLLFRQLKKDSSWLRPALADYILVFRKPGDNQEPITPDLTNDEWIEWAHPVWYGIRESDTLHAAVARDKPDERHVAPLQLGTIERCIRLWSNPGELVLDPFAGIGSTGYEAIRQGRRFVGMELKSSYFEAACRNLEAAAFEVNQQRLL